MFTENIINPTKSSGWIEVITGSMFSGKTEELIRRLKRAILANQKVEIFKPLIDNRYSEDQIVSHDSNQIRSTAIESSRNIILLANNIEVIGIDEAQFFDNGLIETCNQLANQGIRVIVAGLDVDYSGKPFGPMPEMLAIADYITKIHAICVRCGNLARYSHRLSADSAQLVIGESDKYEPLCRSCYHKELNN